MAKVISFLSEDKEQLEEYKKINNEKFDSKISKLTEKLHNEQLKKVKFNEQVDEQIAKLSI